MTGWHSCWCAKQARCGSVTTDDVYNELSYAWDFGDTSADGGLALTLWNNATISTNLDNGGPDDTSRVVKVQSALREQRRESTLHLTFVHL